MNGGTCRAAGGLYECICGARFSGRFCEVVVSDAWGAWRGGEMVWGWGEDLQSPWHLQSLCLDQPCPGAGSRREGDSGRAWEAPPPRPFGDWL